MPYASYYSTGALYGRPLAQLRETLLCLGIEKAAGHSQPEDHTEVPCERAVLPGAVSQLPMVLIVISSKDTSAPRIRRFFSDLEHAKSAHFYARGGTLGRTFRGREIEACSLLY